MTDVGTLIDTINRYNRLSVVFLAMALILMVMSVVLWHKLNIRNSLRVLTGMGARRAVARLRDDSEKHGTHRTEKFSKVAPVITWSSLSEQAPPEASSGISRQIQDSSLAIDLNINKSAVSDIFEVEQDIVYTAYFSM